MTFRFGPYRADRATYQAFLGDRPLQLTPKLLDLLFYLLERPATLVTKEQLLADVWPDANVTDNALAQAVSELREALDDSASAPTYIKTIARRGYRFIAPVEADQDVAAPAPTATPAAAASGTRHQVAVLDFTNVTGDADVAWLAAGIAETVSSDLARLGPFRVVDRWRVIQAVRRTDGSAEAVGQALQCDLVVAGSYQRSGATLRVTAHVIDLASGAAIADAKVDGPIDDVFALQDAVVKSFARALGVPATGARPAAGRETSSLGAYQAYIEGWLRIESLDTGMVPDSIRDFERAIRLDPAYALGHTGLANANFVAYEMTRAALEPDVRALNDGLEHARRAIRLDPGLAEAHATLSFLLVSANRFDEARAAAQQAVTIEPDSWRHQYRLGHASWGATRLAALERAVAIYPQFSYARFEATMVHVARGHLDVAEDVARQGAADQDRQARVTNRFPAIGFHWLLGLLATSHGRLDDALAEFDREAEQADPRRLYGPEYGALSLVGRGQTELARGHARPALASFRAALEHVPGHPRAHLGELLALKRLGDRSGAERAAAAVDRSRRAFDQAGRRAEALYLAACAAVAHDEQDSAIAHLERFLELDPPSYLGWTLPIDPFFSRIRDLDRFPGILERLAARAK